jgi:hypothetical protein
MQPNFFYTQRYCYDIMLESLFETSLNPVPNAQVCYFNTVSFMF